MKTYWPGDGSSTKNIPLIRRGRFGIKRKTPFTIPEANPLSIGPVTLQQPWLGSINGSVYAVLTSPQGRIRSNSSDMQRQVFICMVQDLLIHDEFRDAMGMLPLPRHSARAELGRVAVDLHSTDLWLGKTIQIAGAAVLSIGTTYRDIDFVSGADVVSWPVCLARRSSIVGPWPALAGEPFPCR